MKIILKYTDYITENKTYEILLESKVVLSQKLISFLNIMRNNRIASEIINLNSKEVDGITQNYLDVTDSKDEFSFTPDRKVQELIGDKPEYYRVVSDGRYLTHSDKNNNIFRRLGYVKQGRENWAPSVGCLINILSETQSITGKTYCMVEEVVPVGSEPRIGVINKEAIVIDNEDLRSIWNTSRNPVKIGRFARALLNTAKIPFTNPEIEEFVNQYKATYDIASDRLKQFDIVNSNKIIYWYNQEQYQKGGGSLNNSCMADVNPEYLHIYSENPQVSLVILYDDNGFYNPVDNKYKSNKIKGRALLWDCELNDRKVKFLDRIYTAQDSDVNIFKELAENNGWWYKRNQSMEYDEDLTNGSETINDPKIICKVSDANPSNHYPYMDTMCFINVNDNIIGNSLNAVDPNREYSNRDDEDDEDLDYELIIKARYTDGSFLSID
jgi:hypothetical protein